MATRATAEPRNDTRARAVVVVAVLALVLVLEARCIHGNASVEEICASSTLHFDGGASPPPVAKERARGALSLPSDVAAIDAPRTASQSALLDVRPLFQDLAAEVTPLRLTLTAAAGIVDFRALEDIVVTLAPRTDDAARPPLVVAKRHLSPEGRRHESLTLPLALTSDELARYAGSDEARLTIQLTGVLPPSPFDLAYAACFRAEARF